MCPNDIISMVIRAEVDLGGRWKGWGKAVGLTLLVLRDLVRLVLGALFAERAPCLGTVDPFHSIPFYCIALHCVEGFGGWVSYG